MKASKILAATALISLATAGSALAFHEGGVAYCDGCHTMHNSSGNKFMSGGRNTGLAGWNTNGKASTTQFQGNAYLLQGSDDSSTCLNCHAASDTAASGYHVMTFPAPTVASGNAPVERTPGGDFAWLTQTFPKAGYGAQSVGERHGHNVVAQDYNLVADTTLSVAPGGTYAAASLSCASCHDPHSRARIPDQTTGAIVYPSFGKAVAPIVVSGSYGDTFTAGQASGVYRLLAGANYSQMSYTNATPFSADPPVAVAPSTYNRGESTADTRVAYGQGMSEWCANCHVAIHNNNTNGANAALIHPAGNGAKLSAAANNLAGNATGTTIADIYNAYVKSGDLTGSSASSYTSLVPYEEGTGVIANLKAHVNADAATAPSLAGPDANSNVMCLSCHRAHAGGFNSMTRWNNGSEFLTVDGAWPDINTAGDSNKNSNGMTSGQYQAAMYDRPAGNYASFQRSLCNKCHAKD